MSYIFRLIMSLQDAEKYSISLLVKCSLAQDQYNPPKPRQDDAHFIFGRILDVSETSITIITEDENGRNLINVVYYDAIIYFQSPILTHIPTEIGLHLPICEPTASEQLLLDFKCALAAHQDASDIGVYILFDGIRSSIPLSVDTFAVYTFGIVISQNLIIPLQSFNGYAFVPLCSSDSSPNQTIQSQSIIPTNEVIHYV